MHLIKVWWPLLAFLGLVGLFIAHGLNEGRHAEKLTLANVGAKQAEINKQVAQTKREARHETQPMDRDALVRLHCSRGWVRNVEYCPK